jgi:hypothetical protein
MELTAWQAAEVGLDIYLIRISLIAGIMVK